MATATKTVTEIPDQKEVLTEYNINNYVPESITTKDYFNFGFDLGTNYQVRPDLGQGKDLSVYESVPKYKILLKHLDSVSEDTQNKYFIAVEEGIEKGTEKSIGKEETKTYWTNAESNYDFSTTEHIDTVEAKQHEWRKVLRNHT